MPYAPGWLEWGIECVPCAPLKLSKTKRCLEGTLSIDMRLVRLRNKVRQIDGLEGFLDVCLVRLRNEVRQIDGLEGVLNVCLVHLRNKVRQREGRKAVLGSRECSFRRALCPM